MTLRFAPRLALARLDPDPAELGQLGERLVERSLRRAGWRIAGRRVRTPCGEIDLVAFEPGGAAVALEVKTGRVPSLAPPPDPLLRPGRRLDRAALARRWRAAGELAGLLGLARRAAPRDPVRVDLVELLVDPAGRTLQLHHRGLRRPVVSLPGLRRSPGAG